MFKLWTFLAGIKPNQKKKAIFVIFSSLCFFFYCLIINQMTRERKNRWIFYFIKKERLCSYWMRLLNDWHKRWKCLVPWGKIKWDLGIKLFSSSIFFVLCFRFVSMFQTWQKWIRMNGKFSNSSKNLYYLIKQTTT